MIGVSPVTNIRIVTDSTADIPLAVREALNIEMVPLKINFGEEQYLDTVTLQSEEFLSEADVVLTLSQQRQRRLLVSFWLYIRACWKSRIRRSSPFICLPC